MNQKDHEIVVYADQLPLKVRFVNRRNKSEEDYALHPSRNKSGMFLKKPDMPYNNKTRN